MHLYLLPSLEVPDLKEKFEIRDVDIAEFVEIFSDMRSPDDATHIWFPPMTIEPLEIFITSKLSREVFLAPCIDTAVGKLFELFFQDLLYYFRPRLYEHRRFCVFYLRLLSRYIRWARKKVDEGFVRFKTELCFLGGKDGEEESEFVEKAIYATIYMLWPEKRFWDFSWRGKSLWKLQTLLEEDLLAGKELVNRRCLFPIIVKPGMKYYEFE